MIEIRIEHDIPIPLPRVGRFRLYPFGAMEVGDSFWAPRTNKQISASASSFVRRINAKLKEGEPKIVLMVRKVEQDGVAGARVWRVA